MTSAADFTRQQPQPPPKETPVFIKWIASLDETDVLKAGAIFACLATFASCIIWPVAASDCEARGLVAGAKDDRDVKMSLTFRCTANVDGKWMEVK
jgi:hypothetical protein